MEILFIIGIIIYYNHIKLKTYIFSFPNTSNVQRHAYTLHIVESKDAKWESDNWLMRDPKMPFKFLYENYKKVYNPIM